MAFDQTKYIDDFNKQNYERLQVRVPKGKKQLIEKTARKHGISVNKLIIEAIEEKYRIDLSNK